LMQAKPECFPCILAALLHSARMATDDEWLLRKVLGETMDVLRDADATRTPPEIATEALQHIGRVLGRRDVYEEERRRVNALAGRVADQAKRKIEHAADPLYAALKMAAVANTIDSLVDENAEPEEVVAAFERVSFVAEDYDAFRRELSAAERMLYIFDNAGEIFFDALLVERLLARRPGPEIKGVVRSAPVFNDATLEDARAAGLDGKIPLVDCGVETVGTPLHSCSKEFQETFMETDLILAKGQGNYETLESEISPGRPFSGKSVYFLLTVKCEVVSDALGHPVGTALLVKEV